MSKIKNNEITHTGNSGTSNIILGSSGQVTIQGVLTTTGGLADNSVDGANIALGSDAVGDIMYYNGTDYVRLGKPASDKFLKNTSGGSPSWADAGKVLQVVQTVKKDTFTTAQANTGQNNTDLSYMVDVTGLNVTITPTSGSTKILIAWHISYCADRYTAGIIRRKVGSASAAILTGANATTSGNRPGVAFTIGGNEGAGDNNLDKRTTAGSYLDTHGQTDTLIYNIAVGNTNTTDPELTINRVDFNDENNAYNNISTSTLTAIEFSP